MSFESDVSVATFSAFASPCTIAGSDALCILDRDVSFVDEENRIRDRVTLASFLKSDAASIQFGQQLVVDGDTFTIGRLETDDGHITKFEVHPQ